MTSSTFIGRQTEKATLTELLLGRCNLILHGPTGVGKTALVQQLQGNYLLQKGLITFYYDLSTAENLTDLIRELFQQTEDQLFRWQISTDFPFAEKIQGLTPNFMQILATTQNAVITEEDIQDPAAFLESMVQIWESLHHVYCFFDNFDNISLFKSTQIRLVTSCLLSASKAVHFVLIGRKEEHLKRMAHNTNQPNNWKTQEIENLPLTAYPAECNRENLELLADTLYGNTRCLTQVLQRIQTFQEPDWDSWDNYIDAVNSILDDQDAFFSERWGNTPPKQKELLLAMVQEKYIPQITSTQFMEKYRMASTSSIQYSVQQLEKKDWIFHTSKGYRLADPWFKEWIKRKQNWGDFWKLSFSFEQLDLFKQIASGNS